MADNSNLYPISGVVFKKTSKPWNNDKGSGEIKFITIETTRPFRKKDAKFMDDYGKAKNFPKFQLDFGLDYENFSVGDPIEIKWTIKGEETSWIDKLSGNKIEGNITNIVALELNHPPIDNSVRQPGSKVHVSSMTDSKELDNSMFVPPEPGMDDDGIDQLPF